MSARFLANLVKHLSRMGRNEMPVRPPAKLYFHSPSVNSQDHPDDNDGGDDADQALGADLDAPDADFEFMHGAALH